GVGHGGSGRAAVEGGRSRLRPILVTSCAMIAGMLPMAIGLSAGGDQVAPLGRAVVGGLAASTLATLLILPAESGASRVSRPPARRPPHGPAGPPGRRRPKARSPSATFQRSSHNSSLEWAATATVRPPPRPGPTPRGPP